MIRFLSSHEVSLETDPSLDARGTRLATEFPRADTFPRSAASGVYASAQRQTAPNDSSGQARQNSRAVVIQIARMTHPISLVSAHGMIAQAQRVAHRIAKLHSPRWASRPSLSDGLGAHRLGRFDGREADGRPARPYERGSRWFAKNNPIHHERAEPDRRRGRADELRAGHRWRRTQSTRRE